MFMGKWLRHAYYPNWNLRLFRHRLGRYEKLTDAKRRAATTRCTSMSSCRGDTAGCDAKWITTHFLGGRVYEKHNRYSNWEARVALNRFLHGSESNLQSGTVGVRRKLKLLSQKLPFRPLLRFLYVYLWQRGFLDGREGYYFARLHGFYEFLSVAKTYELKKQASLPRPQVAQTQTFAHISPGQRRTGKFVKGVRLLSIFALIPQPMFFFTFRGSSTVSNLSWMPNAGVCGLIEPDEFRHCIGFAVFASGASC